MLSTWRSLLVILWRKYPKINKYNVKCMFTFDVGKLNINSVIISKNYDYEIR